MWIRSTTIYYPILTPGQGPLLSIKTTVVSITQAWILQSESLNSLRKMGDWWALLMDHRAIDQWACCNRIAPMPPQCNSEKLENLTSSYPRSIRHLPWTPVDIVLSEALSSRIGKRTCIRTDIRPASQPSRWLIVRPRMPRSFPTYPQASILSWKTSKWCLMSNSNVFRIKLWQGCSNVCTSLRQVMSRLTIRWFRTWWPWSTTPACSRSKSVAWISRTKSTCAFRWSRNKKMNALTTVRSSSTRLSLSTRRQEKRRNTTKKLVLFPTTAKKPIKLTRLISGKQRKP